MVEWPLLSGYIRFDLYGHARAMTALIVETASRACKPRTRITNMSDNTHIYTYAGHPVHSVSIVHLAAARWDRPIRQAAVVAPAPESRRGATARRNVAGGRKREPEVILVPWPYRDAAKGTCSQPIHSGGVPCRAGRHVWHHYDMGADATLQRYPALWRAVGGEVAFQSGEREQDWISFLIS